MPKKKTIKYPKDPATKYALSVVAGKTIAGPHVRDACKRHLDDLQTGHKRDLEWDIKEVSRVVTFFKEICTVEKEIKSKDGNEWAAVPFVLEPSQAFIVGSIFGWKKNGIRRFRRAYIEQGKGSGKALAIDTPIPTPDGFKYIGDIVPGDQVFSKDGSVCNVIAVSGVMYNRPCYRLTFSDGSEIVADENHIWESCCLRSGGSSISESGRFPGKSKYSIKTTKDIYNSLAIKESKSKHPQAKWNHMVDCCGILELLEIDLPIPPYTLGAWLCDGDSDSARLTVYKMPKLRLQEVLSETGLLGNKHIPDIYFRASADQRLALIQGMMDTDGSITVKGHAEYTSTNKRLADGLQHLLTTFGIKSTVKESAAKLNGVEVSRRWRVCFKPFKEMPVFSLKRKLNRHAKRPRTRPLSEGRMIVGCEPIESVPVQCISIDHPSQMFLAGRNYIPTHNSPLAAAIGHYMLVACRKIRAEIYSAATDRDQASILFRDAVEMWKRSPGLYDKLIPSGRNPVWQLTSLELASFFKPISSEKKGKSGIRPFCALIDEVHEHKDDSVIEMLRAGTKGNREALIFEISNSGHDKTSVCWAEHEYSIKVASGEIKNDAWFSYVCALDPNDSPFEDESCWIKANPTLGVTIHKDFLREQVREAKGMPSKEGLVRRLHFCQWTDSLDGWITKDLWEAVENQYIHQEDYEGRECYGGIDLSYTSDLTAVAWIYPADDGTFDAFVDFFKPKINLQQSVIRDHARYDLWAEQGYLRLTEGLVIKLAPIAQRMAEVADRSRLKGIAYDRYRHRELADELHDLGIDLPLIEHPQGFRRVNSSLKDDAGYREIDEKGNDVINPLWMPSSVQFLENLIIENKIRICYNPLLRANAASVVVRLDPAGTDNRIFDKRRSTTRIDGIVALAMAAGLAKSSLKVNTKSIYETRGIITF